MKKYSKVTPEGTRDLLFEECGIRKKAETILSDLFAKRGYSEVVTPTIEFLDVFSVKNPGLRAEQMYKLTDGKGRLITLRPDSTIPIARLVATRLKNHSLPIKLFYNQPVFRQNQLLSARSDETVQMGIEIIGSSSRRADLEAIVTAVEALNSCNLDDFRLEIGHVGVFNILIKKLGIDEEQKQEIRQLIEIKNYSELNDLIDTIDIKGIEILKVLPRLFGGVEVFDEPKAKELFSDPDISEILVFLKDIYKSLETLGLGNKISLDLGVANSGDYYTGIVFRGYIEGFGEQVLSGGRYDNLIAEFGEQMPATGFGINVDAVAGATKIRLEKKTPKTLVFAESGYEMKALMYCKKLDGICENCVLDDIKLARDYAELRGIKELHIISEDVVTEKIL